MKLRSLFIPVVLFPFASASAEFLPTTTITNASLRSCSYRIVVKGESEFAKEEYYFDVDQFLEQKFPSKKSQYFLNADLDENTMSLMMSNDIFEKPEELKSAPELLDLFLDQNKSVRSSKLYALFRGDEKSASLESIGISVNYLDRFENIGEGKGVGFKKGVAQVLSDCK